MNVQTVYRIIVRGGIMAVLLSVAILFFSMGVFAKTVKPSTIPAHVLAHPPVTGDCVSCHPDVKTMPRIK